MTDFFRFPQIPHLAWYGTGRPRDDKVVTPTEANALLHGQVSVEEKLDGANIGISMGKRGEFRIQNRGAYLVKGNVPLQFKHIFDWCERHRDALEHGLSPTLILFGEWCYARHSVHYDALPDWFLAFDVYDRSAGNFWSVARRDALVDKLGLNRVPELARGHFDLDGLTALLSRSRVSGEIMEGLVIRRDEGLWLAARAKLVRATFVQALGDHWSSRPLEPNRLAHQGGNRPSD